MTQTVLDKIVAYKEEEILRLPNIAEDLPPSERDFYSAIKNKKGSLPKLIAEIKPASPVKGPVLPEGYDAGEIAQDFENAGASALSILTDTHFFQGSFENLEKAQKMTKKTPLLCKDFILDEKQIRLARKSGADSFLLIAQILEAEEIQNLLNEGRKYNMEPLVEIANEEDLEKVLQTDAKMVGINNRDLRDFSLHLSHTFLVAKKLPNDTLVASLSGFRGADVRLVKEVADAVLVGTNIGKSLPPVKGGLRGVLQSTVIQNTLDEFLNPRPLIKFCGVRTLEDAQRAQEMGVDLLGLNFVSASKRCISVKVAQEISQKITKPKLVGIFQNHSRDEVEKICQKYDLDFAQLSGDEEAEEFRDFSFPLMKGISVTQQGVMTPCSQWDKIADIFLFDGKTPGSGKTIKSPPDKGDLGGLNIHKPFLIAGGVNAENVNEILDITHADGVDTASGVEDENGEWDEERMLALISNLQNLDH